MECNKWQEIGLLCHSKELTGKENSDFSKHLEQCPSCKSEFQQYEYDKKNFFLSSALFESPSEAIDKKIIAACSQSPKTTTGLSIFTGLWLRKAIISSVFLIFGISAGVYFTFNYVKGATSATVASVKKSESAASDQFALSKRPDSSRLIKNDSLKRNESATIANRRGNTSEGMITVDIKKE